MVCTIVLDLRLLLIYVKDPNLYEARAIVLGNMGEHRQALDIYVFKLKDPEKAEEYYPESVLLVLFVS